MDFFEVDYEEPGPSQRVTRRGQSRTRGNATRRPQRGQSARLSNVENWRRPNSNTNSNQFPQQGRAGRRNLHSSVRPYPNVNATYKFNHGNADAANSQPNFQENGQQYGRQTDGERFHRNQGRMAENPVHNYKHTRMNNSNNELFRQTRNMSRLNLVPTEEDDTNQPNRRGYIGFKFLQDLSQKDGKQVITSINEKRDAFIHLLQSPIDRPDLYILIMKVITIACNSSFEQLKSNLLLDVCNSQFINNLRNFLMDLPYTQRISLNSMYWGKPIEFWENFICFCDYIIITFPSIALNKCRSLIEGTSKCCLEGLSERHGFSLPQEHIAKLEQLRQRLTVQEQDSKAIIEPRNRMLQDLESEPPENFRQLSILPQREDLLDRRPYLRPNIINGGYVDIEHYLDIQFRLLREDCFGPLRDGIHQYLEEPNKKKFDNIRIFRNVKFVHPYASKQKLGCVVQVDEHSRKRFKKINWAHSKRFIFGSLVLFTKDNCKTFIIATILDRDIKYLTDGKIPISLAEDYAVNDDIFNTDQSYLMIESEVYFEPYFHILKALQDPKFPEDIAMSKYIVKVDPRPQYPAYLTENSIYKVQTVNSKDFQFTVLNHNTWPSCAELGLNESQYEAYRLALTHEFAVIQGPPGTGKTFLGVKVARTLIENFSRSGGCLLLLICYTNHALDQFLEAIMPITKSIVRIGGQSRSEAMEKFNLNNIRRNGPKINHKTNKLFLEQRSILRRALFDLKLAQEQVDTINYGVLSYKCIRKYVPESNDIGRHFADKKDPLAHWLFANMPCSFDEGLLNEVDDQNTNNTVDDDIFERDDVIFDDIDDDESEVGIAEVSSSFVMSKAETKLRMLLSFYRKSNNNIEKQQLIAEMTVLSSQIKMFEQMSELRGEDAPPDIPFADPSRCPTELRWRIYFGWADRVMGVAREQLKPLQEALLAATTAYEETRMMMDLEVLKNIKVVGMTTSGAARLRKLLLALSPPIVIVEEAAEVMEQHIVTSLTKHCRHLILIGDHQQLRPSAAHMKLARHFNLEVSLFERMIVNDIHSRRLCVQHRMRPEIAALVAPHIYPDLLNHQTVENFPRVLGMCNNLFFFSHNYKEEEVDDSASKANHKEADMVLRLANYLMQQGYDPSDVTVLAAYSGQMFYMRKQRERYAHLSKVKITVVDNYQGEESRIILLSLVRNNSQGNIGFLKTENRVCVALSRAREGFYIFGNIDILKSNSNLWVKIADTLEGNGSLGTSLRLQCEVHVNQITTVTSPNDFEKVPEGGCLLKCNFNLRNCDHQCPLICHGYDRQHVNIKCPLKCQRIICELKHVCPLMCAQKCVPCTKPVVKVLPCGHNKQLPCSWEPTDPRVKCQVQVSVTMPHCAHEAKKACHLDIKYVSCPVSCDARLACGHVCTLKCHVTQDPEHNKYKCEKPCAKAKKGCSVELEGDMGAHQCLNKCHQPCEDCEVEVVKKRSNCKHTEKVACNQNVDEKPCRKNCARVLPCGHFCKKKCYEKCGDCRQQVVKKIPECGHEVSVTCSEEARREICERWCQRTLDCGHPCSDRCAAPCDQQHCTVIMPRKFDSPCGHKVSLPCNAFGSMFTGPLDLEILLKHCSEPCNEALACGHVCGGSCSGCRQGRVHVPCTQTCNQIIICGHQCQEPCNQICPPCTKPCEVKCEHSKCKNLCGQPCVSCQEQCSRRCLHGACQRRCGQVCTLGPCKQACNKLLSCDHPCRGLCGEPCPPICKKCRPDDFPKDFLGDDFEDGDKFILLEDCNHVLELENMDNLMYGDKDTVSIRTCPYCRKPIINTHRYKDFVNDMFKKEINPIKERVYGTAAQIEQKKNELQAKLDAIPNKHSRIYTDKNWYVMSWRSAFNKLVEHNLKKKKVSLLDLEMRFIYVNILEMLSDTYNIYVAANLVELRAQITDQISLICKILVDNKHKISQQQQKDIGVEIKRMNSIIQLAKMLSHPFYLQLKEISKVKDSLKKAKEIVTGWAVYDENKGVIALKELQEVIKVSNIVTKQERELIVKAIGLKAGHWYKCPNGHFYCIGECGGAMQVGKCIECGAEVGGGSHRLLSTNRHAPEIDGSRYAAWSEEYNNMANFNFD